MYKVLTWIILIILSPILLPLVIIIALLHNPTDTMPMPNEDGNVQYSWFVHQLKTTCNFSPKSRIFSWFVGGLNYQIEHHLFPNISHVHYRKLSKIVKETAQEFNIPYHVYPNFAVVLWEHAKHLCRLGNPSSLAQIRTQ